MDECILGRNFLRRIGFNLHDHLLRNGEKIDGKRFDELNSNKQDRTPVQYDGLQYNKVDGDPIPPVDAVGASIGNEDPKYLQEALELMVQHANDQGISEKGTKSLEWLINENRDVFRVKLSADETAKVPPLRIKVKQGARPYRAPQRRYAAQQRIFLAETVKKLEQIGAIYKNPNSKWASPALAVSKQGGKDFRFTVDLRGPNSQTEPIVSAMPHLQSLIQSVQGSRFFAKMDMAHAYWQLPLAKESQEMMSIKTSLGVYFSTRLLQGNTDAGSHFQGVTAEVFSDLTDNILQWLDDFMIHAESEEALLIILGRYLSICKTVGLKLHAKKCELFLTEAKFCGRIISEKGVRFDSSRLDCLINMRRSINGAEFQQFICATNWMRNAIPEYAKTLHPLHLLMESIYKASGKRSKRSITKLSLSGL